MIPITFLAAEMPLNKFFGLSETKSYPLAKKFTSIEYKISPDADGLKEFHKLLVQHASSNHAFYKGNLKRPIIKESRAGLTLKAQKTQLLVIDIDKFEFDNVPTQLDSNALKNLSENIISFLPTQLQNVSYIAQASSSLGMKLNQVSLHLFFLLDEPVSPQMLKWWLCSLNFSQEKFEAKLSLSPVGHNLQYPIDRCLAENSRIIYIAPPAFDENLSNPFKDDSDRFVLVEKEKTLAPVSKLINGIIPQLVQSDIDSKVTSLRESFGLSKKTGRYKMVKVGQNQEENALTNPDKAVIQYAYHNERFCVANLNGGDSNAYYWPLDNPKWVYNFKGEPIFEMVKVDSDFYKWYMEEFREHVVKDANLKPLVFRDFATDAHYTVEYDPETDELKRFAIVARQSLKDFCNQYWEPVPEPIPTWDVYFDPENTGGLDVDNKSLNLFAPTPYMNERITIPRKYQGTDYGMAYETMSELAPNITKLIMHMLGDGELEFEHFINWFAYAFVKRQKSNVAWILHGVEGTGKGLFYTQVIQKIFGTQYSVMKRMTDLEDKFDGWKEHNLLTVVDEFRLSDTTMTSRMYDQIKNMISEPYGTVRYMRSNQKEVPLYSNYLFFSNNEDAMKISTSDRRFCLGLRQLNKIDLKYNIPNLIDGIEEELSSFSQFLREFNIDVHQARVALENEAKTAMRQATNSWVDDFTIALLRGNFTFFMEGVFFFSPTKPEESILHAKCVEAVSQWLLDHIQLATNDILVNVEDARMIYSLMAGREAKPAEFGKILTRRGITAPRLRHNGRMGRFISVRMDFSDYDPLELIKEHGTPTQRQELGHYDKH